MKHLQPLWMLGIVAVVASCSKSNEEEERADTLNGGGTTCNTTNMSFAADIVPLLQANCYACHSNANQSVSGHSLEGYNNVKHHADDGTLLGVITHASGFPPMPKGGAKLSECNINKIRSWINSGAPNN